MTHDEARTLATEGGGETLGAELARQVELHLAECADCREWLEAYRLAAEWARSSARRPAHPASADLARFAVDRAAMDSAVSERLELHLAHCAECRDLIEDVVQAARSVDEGRALATPRSFAGWRLPLAAGLAGAALASALWWSAGRAHSGKLPLEGAQELVWIGVVERGGSATTPLPAVGRQTLFVALAPRVDDLAEGAALRLLLAEPASGRELWSIELDAGRSRAEVARLGFLLVALPIPELVLPPLRLRLEATPPLGATRILLEHTFAPR